MTLANHTGGYSRSLIVSLSFALFLLLRWIPKTTLTSACEPMAYGTRKLTHRIYAYANHVWPRGDCSQYQLWNGLQDAFRLPWVATDQWEGAQKPEVSKASVDADSSGHLPPRERDVIVPSRPTRMTSPLSPVPHAKYEEVHTAVNKRWMKCGISVLSRCNHRL
jgi:hypothetical protein